MHPKDHLTQIYRWLRQYGLNDSHSGNASIRDADTAWITPTGACADTLRAADLVGCHLEHGPGPGASLDAALHLAVYRSNPLARAVLHGHGPYTVALTIGGADFVPPDFEGQYYFGRIPVIDIPFENYLKQSPAAVAEILATHPIAVVRGHGTYTAAEDLNRAYKWTCSLEQSAKTAYLARTVGSL